MKSLNDLSPGRYLGRYELLMPVAQGGMAAVWAARLRGTRGFQKLVAIKTILPTLSDDARFEQMFLDEAGLASRIRHPNVVQVLDLGEEQGLLYQVMEWIDGEPLSTFLRESPPGKGLPYAIAARIMTSVCEGLHAAHELRDDADEPVELVHRDVSPQNILVTRDGVPKVTDFGVAKASSLSNARTTAGTLKGKPAYMAPEQIQGSDVDRKADIFSLGVLLYALTTGVHPFRGDNDMATLHRICSKDPALPPSKHHPDYPEALEKVVLQAVAKDKDERFNNAAATARALEQAVPDVVKTGDSEVAEFMRALLGDRLEARSAALKGALTEADARASLPFVRASSTLPGTGPGPQSRENNHPSAAAPYQHKDTLISSSWEDTSPKHSAPPGAQHTPTENQPALVTIPPSRPSSRGWLGWAGLGAAVLLAGATGATLFFAPRFRRAAAPASAPLTSSVALPADSQPTASVSASSAPEVPEGSGSDTISADTLPPVQPTIRTPRDGKTKDKPPSDEPASTATAAPPQATEDTPASTVPRIRDPGF